MRNNEYTDEEITAFGNAILEMCGGIDKVASVDVGVDTRENLAGVVSEKDHATFYFHVNDDKYLKNIRKVQYWEDLPQCAIDIVNALMNEVGTCVERVTHPNTGVEWDFMMFNWHVEDPSEGYMNWAYHNIEEKRVGDIHRLWHRDQHANFIVTANGHFLGLTDEDLANVLWEER